MSNYWDSVKQEYNESEIDIKLFVEWILNSDPVRMPQIYTMHPLHWVYIPKNIKINYGK